MGRWVLKVVPISRMYGLAMLLAVVISLLLFATQARAQEVTDEDVTVQAGDVVENGGTVDSRAEGTAGDVVVKAARQGQVVEFVEGEQTDDTQRAAQESGPLAGKSVETLDTDDDGLIDLLRIPGNCKAEEGASFVLEDEDGTQGTFIDNGNIDNGNVQINDESTEFLRVRGNPPGTNIVPLLERGGDNTLDSGGLTVVTSTDITCESDVQPDPDPNPDPNPDPGPGPGDGEENPLPQDEDKGPLVGGTAIGEDTNGDLIETLPDGTQVFGIDIIEIAAENCEVTDPDDLTVTIDDQGVPGRFIDGENADITMDESGVTITGGTGPNELLEPFLVEQEDAGADLPPNDTFTVVSTTGIGGEGCKATAASDDADDGDTSDPDDVVPGTDPGGNLADTGGPLFGFMVAGLILTGGGLLLRSTMRRG